MIAYQKISCFIFLIIQLKLFLDRPDDRPNSGRLPDEAGFFEVDRNAPEPDQGLQVAIDDVTAAASTAASAALAHAWHPCRCPRKFSSLFAADLLDSSSIGKRRFDDRHFA
jgi:hypothetical protein